MPLRPAYLITSPSQVRALVPPLRQEIVDILASGGAMTISQLSAVLGRRPDSLYYHVAALKKVGLLMETDRVRAGRRFSARYDVPGRPLRIVYGGKINRPLVSRVVGAALRLGHRDFDRAFDHPVAIHSGPSRNLWGGRSKGWATPADAARIFDLVNEITLLLHKNAPSPDAVPFSFSAVMAPVPPKHVPKRRPK